MTSRSQLAAVHYSPAGLVFIVLVRARRWSDPSYSNMNTAPSMACVIWPLIYMYYIYTACDAMRCCAVPVLAMHAAACAPQESVRLRLPADAIGRRTPVAAGGSQQAALHLRRMIPHDVSIRLHALGRAAEGVAAYIHTETHAHVYMAWHGMAWGGDIHRLHTCSLLWTYMDASSSWHLE